MWKQITQEQTLSNNKALRSISDWFDRQGFKGTPRAVTHAMYHLCIGSLKFIVRNTKGSKAEFKRVGEQLRRVGNSPHRQQNEPKLQQKAE